MLCILRYYDIDGITIGIIIRHRKCQVMAFPDGERGEVTIAITIVNHHIYHICIWIKATRVPLMYTAVNMIKDNWLMGVGVNNYPFHQITRHVPLHLRYAWSYIVHNEYLLRLAETGIIGTLLYYTLTLLMMIKLWRSTRSSDPWVFLVSAGLFAAMIGSIPHRVVSYYHYVNFFMQLCVVLALTQYMGTLDMRKRYSETEE